MKTTKWTYRIYETKLYGTTIIAIDVLYNGEWYRWNFADYNDPTDLAYFSELINVLFDEESNTKEILFVANVDDSHIKNVEVLNDDDEYIEALLGKA